MPEMGESVAEGTILEWHKQEGDRVEEGETVVEVSTDKVDAEVPAPASGTITELRAQADETVKVGQVLAEMKAGEAPSGDLQKADGKPQEAAMGPASAEAEGTDGEAGFARGSPHRGGQRGRPDHRQGLGTGRQGDQGRRAGGGGRQRRRGDSRRATRRWRSSCAARPRCWPRP